MKVLQFHVKLDASGQCLSGKSQQVVMMLGEGRMSWN